MAARAMLPVGFMPAAGEQGFGVVLCGVSAPKSDKHAHHHHEGAEQESASTSKHGGLTCPFAHAALGSPTSFAPLAGAVVTRSTAIALADAQHFVSFGPPRIDRVRGPPTRF